MFDANKEGEVERATGYGGKILELSVEVGGTITGEHGVGIEKVGQMCAQFSPEELAAFRGVKASFDEHTLLNPGKAVPTPRRCSEYRLTGSAK
jgi:glycolate oxidase